MSIKGSLQTTKTNDYGFTSIKMGGAWYGSDKKNFKPDAQEGDLIEFEAFKNAKGYDTYKAQSFKRLRESTNSESAGSNTATSNVRVDAGVSGKGFSTGGTRDTYWADKAKADEAKDPRIVYQSSYERAILFTDLAIKNECFEALKKAKPTAKLDILEKFVGEQAARIMAEVYAAAVPTAPKAAPATVSDLPEEEKEETDENWS